MGRRQEALRPRTIGRREASGPAAGVQLGLRDAGSGGDEAVPAGTDLGKSTFRLGPG
jgi:hypothetical protein